MVSRSIFSQETVMRCPAFLYVLICTCGLLSSVASSAEKPNVLLITADDLGLQLSCYGETLIQTPHMDALAARGVQFTTGYVAQASCSPSRSALFTGMYPHGNGHYGLANAGVGFQVHEELRSDLLPNVLKRAGYRTGIIGKLHVNPEKAFEFDQRYAGGFGDRDIAKQVSHAESFWQETGEHPWFLMFNVFDPHVARDRGKNGQRGPQYFPDVVKGIPENPLSASDVEPWPWQQIERPEQMEKIAGYYNCVQRIDVAIGRLMKSLADAGHADDTLIILLGDHGPPFARGKTSCYEAGLRVPFLVYWPGVSEPHVSPKLVSSTDIYPTILDAVGVAIPKQVHGRSLRSVLTPIVTRNPHDTWREALVGEFHYHGADPFFPRRAITDGRFKLIHNLRADESTAPSSIDGDKASTWASERPEGDVVREVFARLTNPPEWEFYDLESDPIEFVNLANSSDAEVAAARERLQGSLKQWQQETSDPFGDAAFREKVMAKYVK